jgi:hypothetical protein
MSDFRLVYVLCTYPPLGQATAKKSTIFGLRICLEFFMPLLVCVVNNPSLSGFSASSRYATHLSVCQRGRRRVSFLYKLYTTYSEEKKEATKPILGLALGLEKQLATYLHQDRSRRWYWFLSSWVVAIFDK